MVAKVSVLHNLVASMTLWCLIVPRLNFESQILTIPHFSLGISAFQSRNLVLWNDVIQAQFVIGWVWGWSFGVLHSPCIRTAGGLVNINLQRTQDLTFDSSIARSNFNTSFIKSSSNKFNSHQV
jgi:hypothetical protein